MLGAKTVLVVFVQISNVVLHFKIICNRGQCFWNDISILCVSFIHNMEQGTKSVYVWRWRDNTLAVKNDIGIQ